VTEAWLRQYQVLPGRTHPMMNTSGSGGYLLTATKIYDDATANSTLIARNAQRKALRAAKLVAANGSAASAAISSNGMDVTGDTLDDAMDDG